MGNFHRFPCRFQRSLKDLISWNRCTYLGLGLNSAGLWPSRNWVRHPSLTENLFALLHFQIIIIYYFNIVFFHRGDRRHDVKKIWFYYPCGDKQNIRFLQNGVSVLLCHFIFLRYCAISLLLTPKTMWLRFMLSLLCYYMTVQLFKYQPF